MRFEFQRVPLPPSLEAPATSLAEDLNGDVDRNSNGLAQMTLDAPARAGSSELHVPRATLC